ncbi:hypothetical protein [Sporosarcina highlanderae]|uniref:Uncharacterized protein n=1 Tax=Sporosarcina highlanderae TaxID=3035916 RepID=A0ABT8JQZ1_9BACL|nr:hypothetical protein [Sporosarcina highlanderae]MDN4607500.1 hypothetical protein [Sporosarcina highlanderae]
MMKRLTACVLIILFLVGCNPKPQEKVEEILEDDIVTIENSEKLIDVETFFENGDLLEGLERIYRYYGNDFPAEEQEKVGVYEDFGEVSKVDLMNLMAEKGIDTLPSNKKAEDIDQMLKEGKPVYASFTLINAENWYVLFYGYSAEEFAYYNLKTDETKTIGKKRIEALGEFYTVIPYKVGELTEDEKEQSHLYVRLKLADAYWKDDPTTLKKYVDIAEQNDWLDGLNYGYFYIYHYLFHDPQPERAAKYVEAELERWREPFTLEAALKYYSLQNEEVEIKRTLRDIQIMQGFRRETLQFIIDNGEDYGYPEKATEAAEVLKKKKQ